MLQDLTELLYLTALRAIGRSHKQNLFRPTVYPLLTFFQGLGMMSVVPPPIITDDSEVLTKSSLFFSQSFMSAAKCLGIGCF